MGSSLRKPSHRAITYGELPSIFIEKIKILPTNFKTEEQEVEITFSLQSLGGKANLQGGHYMVFAAFTHQKAQVTKMRANELLVKNLIRNPKIGEQTIKKYYKTISKGSRRSAVPFTTKRVSYRVHKKEVKCVYKCPIKNLKDLYVYATVYATDLQTVSKSGVDRKLRAMKIGTPVVEEIMRNGYAPLAGMIYTLKEDVPGYGVKGDVWSGPVHFNTSLGFMVGNKHTETISHPRLNRTAVSNQKTVDLRFINDVKRLSFANSPADLLRTLSRRQRKDLEVAKKVLDAPGHISDCIYSRASDNELKIFFSIDYERLGLQNTKLGYFIKNKNSLASCFQIEDIRVYRTRINPISIKSNKLTPGVPGVQGGNPNLSTLKLVGSLKDGTVRPITFAGSRPEITNILVFDSEMANKHHGTYEYKVFIDMVDLSVSAISTLATGLSRVLSRYNKFLAAASLKAKPGSNIKARMKREKKFTRELQKSWKALINSYIGAIDFIYGDAAYGAFNSMMWRKNLIAMVNPANADINTMRMVSEIVTRFSTALQRLYKKTGRAASDTKFNARSKIRSTTATRRKAKIEYTFPSRYLQVGTADNGADYLDDSLTANNLNNFTNISFSKYETRIGNELTKFTIPRPNAPGINKFGFLSPQRLNTPGQSIDTSTKMLAQDSGNRVLAASLNKNTKTTAYKIRNNPKQSYDKEIAEILGTSGITIVENTRPLVEMLYDPKPLVLKTRIASKYLNDPSFSKDILDRKTSLSGSSTPRIKQSKSRKSQIKRSKLVKHINNARAFNFKNLPPPIYGSAGKGSIATAAIEQEPANIKNNSSFGTSINFNSLVEIQYFDGYLKTGGILNIDAPIWRTLTQAKFKILKQNGTPVLCRMLRVSKAFNIPSHYELPNYDNLFILGDTPALGKSINYAGGNYITVLANKYKQLDSEMKNVVLNIESPMASVDTEYMCISPELSIISTHKPRPVVKGPVQAGFANGQRRGSGNIRLSRGRAMKRTQRKQRALSIPKKGGSY